MTGRARARARGRARGQEMVQHVGASASQQPGYIQSRPQQPPAEGELVGRGRLRGTVGATAKSQELQISAGFQELSLAERGGRRRDFHDLGVNTRQNLDHVKESKTGSSGIIVRLSTNHFRLTSRPQWALYQYHIDYNPLMEARRLRSALLFQHEDLIGRLLKIMNLQQIGRNYYNPSDPIDIPNHRYNNKTYRVDDIDWDQNPKSTFKKADGSEVSFLEYYRKQYNQEITDLKQPVLVSQPKRRRGPGGTLPGPAMLIPELCYLTGLTDKMRNDFNVMKDLAVHTRLTPEQRQREVGRLIDYIHKDDNVQRELRDWGLSFDSNLLSFSGRILQAEKIHQGGKTFDYNPQFADWSKETRGAPLISVKPLDNWLLIYTRRNYEAANSLIQNLFKVTPAMGIQMKKAIMIEVDDRTEAYLRVLQQKVTSDTQIVVCLLSSNRKDKYDAIKKYLCTDCPTPSQCVVARTLGKQQTVMAIATKIALQMNCKMGGELWRIDMPLKLAMIVGIDCYHDTTAGRRSIAGFVASINEGMTRWFSRCVFQDRGQELVDGLKVCLQAALRAWNSCNEYMPSRIIVYRDGVGDGQLKTLVNYEVPQFLDCLKSLGRGYNPRLTVIVVKKRVNARFFAQSGGRLQNPLPGTVIDVEVTRPEWYDFFIVSQAVRSGSVSPTHYNVIYDNSGLKPDHIQRLTYKLCHVYYNWPGVIRVPAPCQYAHKLAFLVGQSIHREPNLSLSNRLYYL
ncbi:piwi-like protein 1 isoform 6-T8 [Dama dama]|uniref:piwi-like protein 1 isoform X7 n=1 Tax=Dama dama TaxID=30532 RepID=UPI002A36CDF2|nr:piwi-like protein 1 isoform X7 [Dama dama]